MSRTRIVKGKITERVKGDISIYSASNIIETSLQSIVETGKEKGISFGQPSKPPEYQPENTITLYIGMFFDGTGNNRFNSESLYYTKVKGNNDRIKSSEIPTQLSFTLTPEKIKEKDISKINISNRDSYWNPYSNIVKLHDLYKEKSETDLRTKKNKYTLKQYVEGIGTEKYKEDSVGGSSVGRGDTGIIAKVERGIKDLVKEKIAPLPKDKKIYKIVFDVFGFSRGAAAARHFCNEVKKPAYYVTRTKRDPYDKYDRNARILTDEKDLVKHAGGILGAELNKIGLKPYEETYNNIEIRFLGLFDTVVSDLVVKENIGYKIAPFFNGIPIIAQEYLEDIKTNISGLGIKKVFQIRANDEWRANFAYTPTEDGYTLYMLGAHSDIGGGYAELDKYTSILGFFDATKGGEEIFKQQEKIQKYFIDNNYCKENEIWFEKIYEHTSGFYIESSPTETTPIYEKISGHYILKTSRYISNKYSLVPMYVMLQKAIDHGVPFYKNYKEAADDDADVKNSFEHEIPDTEEFKMLREYLKKMLDVSKDESKKSYSLSSTEMFKHIRNRYVHLSSHYAGLDTLGHKDGDHHFSGDLLFINRPVKYKEDENGKIFYEREIYK
jgi:putative rhs element vgr protein